MASSMTDVELYDDTELYIEVLRKLLEDGWIEPRTENEKIIAVGFKNIAVKRVGTRFVVFNPSFLYKLAREIGVQVYPSEYVMAAGQHLPLLFEHGVIREKKLYLEEPLEYFLSRVQDDPELFKAVEAVNSEGVRTLVTVNEMEFEFAILGWTREVVEEILTRFKANSKEVDKGQKDLKVAKKYLSRYWEADRLVDIHPKTSGYEYGATLFLRRKK